MSKTIFHKCDREHLVVIANKAGLKVAEKESVKKIATRLDVFCTLLGTDLAIQDMKLAELRHIVEKSEVELSDRNSETKTVMQKYLYQHIEKDIDTYFQEAPSSVISVFAEIVGSQNDNKQTLDVITWNGAQSLLNRCEVPFLKEVMESLELDCETDSKIKIVTALASNDDAKAEDARERPTASRRKLPLKEGITYQDIFQHYYLDELMEFVEEHGLKKSGNKPDIIRRIVAFLDGDTENTLSNNRTAKEAKPAAKNEKSVKTVKKTKASKDVESREDVTA